MAKGFLTMFEDPVVGPQLALGALSAGIGLLTARKPQDVNNALQGGISNISQAMLYGGQQQEKQDLAQAKLDERAAAAARIRKIFGGNQEAPAGPIPPGPPQAPPRAMPGTAPLSSPYVQGPPPMLPPGQVAGGPQNSPAVPGAGGSFASYPPEVAELAAAAMEYPQFAPIVNPIIAQMMAPRKKTPFQDYLEMAGIPEGSEKAQRLALMKLGGAPTIDQTAMERYRQQLDEDRNAGLDIQRRAQGLTAAGQAQTAANQAASRALELEKFAYEKSKPPPMSDFARKMEEAKIPPGSPEYLAAAKANIPKEELSAFDEAMKRENIDPGTPEYMAAAKKARPGEGSNIIADLISGGALPGTTLPPEGGDVPIPAAPPPPAPPPTDGPPAPPPALPVIDGNSSVALGGGSAAVPVVPETPAPVSTLGEREDVRLEKRLGPEKAAGLRTMLGAITDPAKQKRASGVLRRVAKGTLGIANAAKELEALGL